MGCKESNQTKTISSVQIYRFSPIFIYSSILTRSSLGLLHVIVLTFVPELWPLIYAKILFLFYIPNSFRVTNRKNSLTFKQDNKINVPDLFNCDLSSKNLKYSWPRFEQRVFIATVLEY